MEIMESVESENMQPDQSAAQQSAVASLHVTNQINQAEHNGSTAVKSIKQTAVAPQQSNQYNQSSRAQ